MTKCASSPPRFTRRRRLVLAATLPTDTRRTADRVLAVCAVSVAIWLFGNPAHAQDAPASRPVEFGVMAGGVGVTGQFRGRISSGPAAGAEAQFSLSPHWLALRADVMYQGINNYQITCHPDPNFCSLDGNATRVVSGGVGVVARLNAPDARWSPYVVAGIATYYVDKSDSFLMATVRTNPFGWQGGLGIEVRSSRHVFFAEMRYMTIAPGGVVPIMVGMRF
jgi:opacity protein-like surface antigen